jgi:hypothetical protein
MMGLSRGGNLMRAAITSAALLGLGILAALSVTHAQQSGKMKRIGIISTIPLATWRTLPGTHALLSELHDLGYDEGQNSRLNIAGQKAT